MTGNHLANLCGHNLLKTPNHMESGPQGRNFNWKTMKKSPTRCAVAGCMPCPQRVGLLCVSIPQVDSRTVFAEAAIDFIQDTRTEMPCLYSVSVIWAAGLDMLISAR